MISIIGKLDMKIWKTNIKVQTPIGLISTGSSTMSDLKSTPMRTILP